jgi:hypothetical protein
MTGGGSVWLSWMLESWKEREKGSSLRMCNLNYLCYLGKDEEV